MNVSFLAAGIASDVGILQTLLQSSLPATEVTQSMTRLVAADGSQVLLTVERSSESEKTRSGFDVHVQCPTVFLLSQLRSAVCAKVLQFFFLQTIVTFNIAK